MRFEHGINPVDDDCEIRLGGVLFCYLSRTNHWFYVRDIKHPLNLSFIKQSYRPVKQLNMTMLRTITSQVLI